MAIIFICPESPSPIGGVKVIYRQCQLLDEHGIESYVLHPGNPEFSCRWFRHRARFRTTNHIDPERDFAIIPEFMAESVGGQCLRSGVGFAIYVQNGYTLNHGGSYEALARVYRDCRFILSISDDTSAAIRLAFPGLDPEKIVRTALSIDPVFAAGPSKQRQIAFMPRKLRQHAELLAFFLRPHLPPGWTLRPIENRSEEEVAASLAETSIFLSFSHIEGLGLPPLEAALCGNIVVGYTGEGGKEYFAAPVFREVANGDFRDYVAKVLQAIAEAEGGIAGEKAFLDGVGRLREVYGSRESEWASLKRWVAML